MPSSWHWLECRHKGGHMGSGRPCSWEESWRGYPEGKHKNLALKTVVKGEGADNRSERT